MNRLHRLIAGAIKLYARLAAAAEAFATKGQRINEVEDTVEESLIRGRMMAGDKPEVHCLACHGWNGHAQGCPWVAAHQQIQREQRTPAEGLDRKDD